MHVSVSKQISAPQQAVWQVITDIEGSAKVISSIINIEILTRPDSGLTGLKWQETRKVFGKVSTETMWITHSQENQYYITRAESHGCIYTSKLAIEQRNGEAVLTMSFSGEPQTFFARLMTFLMGRMIEKAMVKELEKDLSEIKQHVETVTTQAAGV